MVPLLRVQRSFPRYKGGDVADENGVNGGADEPTCTALCGLRNRCIAVYASRALVSLARVERAAIVGASGETRTRVIFVGNEVPDF